MHRLSSRWGTLLAGAVGILVSTVYAVASPCPSGMDDCAGRPGCSVKTYDHSYPWCSTVTDSNGIPWCCNYSIVVYDCGDGTRCSVSSLSSGSFPCSC